MLSTLSSYARELNRQASHNKKAHSLADMVPPGFLAFLSVALAVIPCTLARRVIYQG